MTNLTDRCKQQEQEIIALKAQLDVLKSIILTQRAAAPSGSEVQKPTGVDALPTLTLKQHATLLGVCAHLSWEQLADHMRVDRTTVKLHLRSLSEKLGTPGTRTEVAAKWAPVIERIDDAEYKTKYGLHKHWWQPGVEDRATLTLLRTKRSGGHG